MEKNKELLIQGAVYDMQSGKVAFCKVSRLLLIIRRLPARAGPFYLPVFVSAPIFVTGGRAACSHKRSIHPLFFQHHCLFNFRQAVGDWQKGNYMNLLQPIRLRALKTRTVFLLKDLYKGSPASLSAARLLLKVPAFTGKSFQWLLDHPEEVKLKHGYQAIALDLGFTTWASLKHTVVLQDCLYRPGGVAYIHAWFRDYFSAEVYFKQHGDSYWLSGRILLFAERNTFNVWGLMAMKCIGKRLVITGWNQGMRLLIFFTKGGNASLFITTIKGYEELFWQDDRPGRGLRSSLWIL